MAGNKEKDLANAKKVEALLETRLKKLGDCLTWRNEDHRYDIHAVFACGETYIEVKYQAKAKWCYYIQTHDDSILSGIDNTEADVWAIWNRGYFFLIHTDVLRTMIREESYKKCRKYKTEEGHRHKWRDGWIIPKAEYEWHCFATIKAPYKEDNDGVHDTRIVR
jgi:hypothetical protein